MAYVLRAAGSNDFDEYRDRGMVAHFVRRYIVGAILLVLCDSFMTRIKVSLNIFAVEKGGHQHEESNLHRRRPDCAHAAYEPGFCLANHPRDDIHPVLRIKNCCFEFTSGMLNNGSPVTVP